LDVVSLSRPRTSLEEAFLDIVQAEPVAIQPVEPAAS
jgi:hypothetical protein